MSKKHNNQPTALEIVFIGIFKGIWWIVKLPFGGLKRKSGLSTQDKIEIRKKVGEIEKLVSSDNIIESKHAVMEADKLVDKVMKLKGYTGQTFADRLRSAEKYIDKGLYQKVWEGHKIRNRIAHDEGNVSEKELKSAVKKLLTYCKL